MSPRPPGKVPRKPRETDAVTPEARAAYRAEAGHGLARLLRLGHEWTRLVTLASRLPAAHAWQPRVGWIGPDEAAALDAFAAEAAAEIGGSCPAARMPRACRVARARSQGAGMQSVLSDLDGSNAEAVMSPVADWSGAVRWETEDLHAEETAMLTALAVAWEHRKNPTKARHAVAEVVEWLAYATAHPDEAPRHWLRLIPPEAVALRVLHPPTPSRADQACADLARLLAEPIEKGKARTWGEAKPKAQIAELARRYGVTVRTLHEWLAQK